MALDHQPKPIIHANVGREGNNNFVFLGDIAGVPCRLYVSQARTVQTRIVQLKHVLRALWAAGVIDSPPVDDEHLPTEIDFDPHTLPIFHALFPKDEFLAKVDMLHRPYIEITEREYEILYARLVEAKADFFALPDGRIVTVGNADGGFAIMPVKPGERHKLKKPRKHKV